MLFYPHSVLSVVSCFSSHRFEWTKGYGGCCRWSSEGQVRKDAYQNFRRTRLQKDPPTVKLHDKLTKLSLKTFIHKNKMKISKAQTKEVVFEQKKKLVGHIIIFVEGRLRHMSYILAHMFGHMSWAHSNGCGSQRRLPAARA